MHRVLLAVLAAFLIGTFDAQAASELTAAVFGKTNRTALKKAYFDPFLQATGVTVNDEMAYDGTEDLKLLVRGGKPRADIVQVETRTLELGCKDGLFEKLDPSRIGDKADFVPGTISECGVGIFAWSQAFVYNADKVTGTPSSWADFWDVKKFPGKRGLRRSAKYTLEIALLADGVAPSDVYKLLATKQGVDRAFRMLDKIKPDTVWWEAAPQPALFIGADRVVMSSSYTVWIDAEQRSGKNYKIVWNGSLYDFDNWAIPKGTTKIADAYKLIAFASKPENQKVFSTELAYGPVNRKALAMLEPKVANALPTAEANLKGALAINIPFWIQRGAELEKRFADWAPTLTRQTIEEHEHPVQEPHKHDKDAAPHAH